MQIFWAGLFVLDIKNTETEQPSYKPRLVVQGHTDKEKEMLVHNSNTIRQHSIRILVTMAAIHGFNIWSQDVSQAYLQANDGLKREVFVKAPEEFQLGPDKLLMLKKPLYGLTDSGDYWSHTLRRHLREDLK